MNKIQFSFIIPAHNEEKVIEKCISSILMQAKKNYEVIVVNDGSKDNTKAIVESMMKKNKSIKLVNNLIGSSAAYARNKGSKIAEGDYLVFLDADQFLGKDFLERLGESVEKNKFEVGAIRILSAKPKSIFQRGWHAYRSYNKCATPIIQKKVFDKFGYNEKLFYVEDDVFFEDARSLGYKIFETKLLIYHIDPQTFQDYYRQRKSQGRGLVTKIFYLKKYSSIRYFLPLITLPLMFVWVPTPFIYLFAYWIFFTLKSKEPFNSFWWISTDFIGRIISFFWFVLYSFVPTKKIKNKNEPRKSFDNKK